MTNNSTTTTNHTDQAHTTSREPVIITYDTGSTTVSYTKEQLLAISKQLRQQNQSLYDVLATC